MHQLHIYTKQFIIENRLITRHEIEHRHLIEHEYNRIERFKDKETDHGQDYCYRKTFTSTNKLNIHV